MGQPRFMLAAPSSGSGKTLITCGILQAFTDRGLNVASFKCGPDYIDPMFHSRVIGTPSWNLDPFFTGEDTLRYLFARHAAEAQLSVMEGVMGYYDGLGGTTDRASAYDLARITGTPVILIVNTKGMSLSLGALIKGFTEYREGQPHPRRDSEPDVSYAVSPGKRAAGTGASHPGIWLCAKAGAPGFLQPPLRTRASGRGAGP